MNKRIFILNGTARSGKDTFADILQEAGIETVHYSYVEFTRTVLRQLGFNVDEKTEKMRKLLCDINDCFEEYGDIPHKDCVSIANDFKSDKISGKCLLIDCREPKKIERLKNELGAQTIFIKSNTEAISSNKADKAVSTKYVYNYYINNTGTLDEFKHNVMAFAKYVGIYKRW